MFPAGAGVILGMKIVGIDANCVPRRCGGDPLPDIQESRFPLCSPQVRG